MRCDGPGGGRIGVVLIASAGVRLEAQDASNLHIAWRVGPAGLAKGAILKIGVHASRGSGGSVVDAIEEVEGIEAKLEVESLGNCGHLLQREVDVSIARIPELVGHLVSFHPHGRRNEVSARQYSIP